MTELKEFIEQMRATSSSNEKVKILKQQSEFIQRVLEYTYNPYKQYYVTSKTCIKNFMKSLPISDLPLSLELFDVLNKLNNRVVTGHDAIRLVNSFIASCPNNGELIYKIIDKNLDIRTGAKVINKAFPNLIPEFNVALAKTFEEKDVDFNAAEWYASRKLDGVRCLAVVDEMGKCTLYSRMGKELTTLNSGIKFGNALLITLAPVLVLRSLSIIL